jgi:hypothetical protein
MVLAHTEPLPRSLSLVLGSEFCSLFKTCKRQLLSSETFKKTGYFLKLHPLFGYIQSVQSSTAQKGPKAERGPVSEIQTSTG